MHWPWCELRSWTVVGRIACGPLALTVIPIWALTVESFAGLELAVTTARGLWVALYCYSFLALFMIAAAIPHRPLSPLIDRIPD